jgi:hypothetical protein
MTMDELRRQLATIEWPIILRVDGKEIAVSSRNLVMIPPAGNLICIYNDGAFQVIDCEHVSIIGRTKSARKTAS